LNDRSGTQNVVFTRPISPAEGLFSLTDAPGLGLEIVEEELAKRQIPWTAGKS
jgi:L-alanine-DL-glutamate epimerase-like enolase superfamily enzyme